MFMSNKAASSSPFGLQFWQAALLRHRRPPSSWDFRPAPTTTSTCGPSLGISANIFRGNPTIVPQNMAGAEPAGRQFSLQRGTQGRHDDRYVRERARDAAIARRQGYPVRRAQVQLDRKPQRRSQRRAVVAFDALPNDPRRTTARDDRRRNRVGRGQRHIPVYPERRCRARSSRSSPAILVPRTSCWRWNEAKPTAPPESHGAPSPEPSRIGSPTKRST